MFSNETSKYAGTAHTLIGPEAIRAALKTMPNSPGVYRMIGAEEKILYIGKAKNLPARVASYANLRDLSTRILRMVNQVVKVEFTVTQSEAEALLVEANFVRRYKPRYNILLKDDKSFPYLLINRNHAYPRIEKHRGAQDTKGEYFGPFASVGALNETMALLQKIFLLRPCSDSYFKNRTRPCLQYQIKRCSAPCVNYISEDAYGEQLIRARDFLKGRHRDIQETLAREMTQASEAMDYEKAALLRDRIRALTQVQQEQNLRTAGLADADVIALARRGAKSVVQVSFYRQGNHFGQQSFHPTHEADATDGEVMAAFLAQFYQAHTPPPEILVNSAPAEIELLTEALSLDPSAGQNVPPPVGGRLGGGRKEAQSSLAPAPPQPSPYRGGRKITIRQPLRGDKLALMTLAAANAEAALMKSEMERAAIASNLVALQALFNLPRLPQRIEVYDNSHISGKNAIGAFIVATPEGFDKRSYRTFNIKDITTEPGDDYAMMREVFRRRFKGQRPCDAPPSVEEETDTNCPDLVLIDGGLGQLNAVMEALQDKDVRDIAFVAIAKGVDRNAGREWFFTPGREPFQLPINDPLLHYLQRLRDEVHRFAIGRHRNKRSAALTVSALDDIPGIGSTRKRALLQHFGSRADVEKASLAELQKVTGISKTIARSIYDYFHGA